MSRFKPQGYPSVSPYLVVNGAQGTIDFLRQVFGATELYRVGDDSGRIHHAEIRIDDSVIMLADGQEGWDALPAHIHIYVPDVDACHARALAAGAENVQTPLKKDDADKRGGVRDAGGTTWWIGTRVE